MSDLTVPFNSELRSVLAAHGFDALPRTDEASWFAHGRVVRCVSSVGDRLAESLRLDADGQVGYTCAWSGPDVHAGVPEEGPFDHPMPHGGVLPARGARAPFEVTVSPSGDPTGRSATVVIEATLEDPEHLGALIERMRQAASEHALLGGAEPSTGRAQAPYFLLEPGMVAVFQEWIEDQPAGWGTYEVLSAHGGAALYRATIEQADSRGDRYRFDLIQTSEGVAAEVHGKKNLVVHDWIWRFPLQEREWSEEIETSLVSMQLYPVEGPVDIAAGRFWGCWRLSTMNENGSQVHTYHPTAGLILSEFTDVEGTPGRRELCALERRGDA